MSATSYKLTDAFVQSTMLVLQCKRGESASIDLPEGTKTFVVTNPAKSASDIAWVSFGAKDADLKAFEGLGHELMSGHRLIVQASPGAAKVAAIVAHYKGDPVCTLYIECGEGGTAESRTFRV